MPFLTRTDPKLQNQLLYVKKPNRDVSQAYYGQIGVLESTLPGLFFSQAKVFPVQAEFVVGLYILITYTSVLQILMLSVQINPTFYCVPRRHFIYSLCFSIKFQ